MDDPIGSLRAQLDKDERIARAASWTDDANAWHAEPSPFGARDGGQRWYVEDAMDDGVVSHVDPVASDDESVARHIARHDPARELREVEAKRRIVDAYEHWQRRADSGEKLSEFERGSLAGLYSACRTLAEAHPDYRAERRP